MGLGSLAGVARDAEHVAEQLVAVALAAGGRAAA